jgi:hypothetical protein
MGVGRLLPRELAIEVKPPAAFRASFFSGLQVVQPEAGRQQAI